MLLYKVCIRSALLYDNEIWPLTQYLENCIRSLKMRMLRYILKSALKNTNKMKRSQTLQE